MISFSDWGSRTHTLNGLLQLDYSGSGYQIGAVEPLTETKLNYLKVTPVLRWTAEEKELVKVYTVPIANKIQTPLAQMITKLVSFRNTYPDYASTVSSWVSQANRLVTQARAGEKLPDNIFSAYNLLMKNASELLSARVSWTEWLGQSLVDNANEAGAYIQVMSVKMAENAKKAVVAIAETTGKAASALISPLWGKLTVTLGVLAAAGVIGWKIYEKAKK